MHEMNNSFPWFVFVLLSFCMSSMFEKQNKTGAGKLLPNCRPPVGQLLADSQPTVNFGNYSSLLPVWRQTIYFIGRGRDFIVERYL